MLLAPDESSDVFVFVRVVSCGKAHSWAKPAAVLRQRGHPLSRSSRHGQITSLFAQEAEVAPKLLFAGWSDTVPHCLGIGDVTPRAACVSIGKVQLETFGSLMPEEQFEALWLLAEGFEPVGIYRDLFSARQAVAVEEAEGRRGELAAAVRLTRSRIVLVTGPEWLAGTPPRPRLHLATAERQSSSTVGGQGRRGPRL
ncbi:MULTISPECIES: hypothetical protein [unclassified Streptomyces]|uniref:hypothetical protein n=1 Tax=unclassified Streptomyces TaxID=2593676 RepID=UPI00344E2AD9